MKLEGPTGPCATAQPRSSFLKSESVDFSVSMYFAHSKHAADVYSVLKNVPLFSLTLCLFFYNSPVSCPAILPVSGIGGRWAASGAPPLNLQPLVVLTPPTSNPFLLSPLLPGSHPCSATASWVFFFFLSSLPVSSSLVLLKTQLESCHLLPLLVTGQLKGPFLEAFSVLMFPLLLVL